MIIRLQTRGTIPPWHRNKIQLCSKVGDQVCSFSSLLVLAILYETKEFLGVGQAVLFATPRDTDQFLKAIKITEIGNPVRLPLMCECASAGTLH